MIISNNFLNFIFSLLISMANSRISLSILFLFISSIGFGQLDGDKQEDKWMEDNIFLDGEVTDYYTGESISGVSIKATVNGSTTAQGLSDGKGEYKTVLEYDKIYTITFSKPGYSSKIITMDTRGVADLKRQKVPDMGAEITLFKPNDCIKTDLLDAPIGRAMYFKNKNVMDWDMEYSMPRLEKLNKLLDKCEKEAKRQKELEEQMERDYNAAMKEADNAFAKEDWETAREEYKKAIELFNDRPEPKNKLKLIETELAKKAEAEKQRAEEKARAEAEALAKAEAEAAAKKEEEERIAKEKAEADVLAKAEAEAKEKAKAEAAAKKAEEERIAKEKAEAEVLAKAEAEAKEKEANALAQMEKEKKAKLLAQKEAETKKIAETNAKKEEANALAQMEKEKEAKFLAQEEANKRAAAEEKANKEKNAAEKREAEERIAKEEAAKLAKKAEDERAVNAKILLEVKAEVKVEVEKREEQERIDSVVEDKNETKTKDEITGSPTIKIKRKNPTRHLYVKPNKHRKGKGPQPKKRIVF